MELDKLATKMSGCPPGSREYLACYRVAVSTVEKGLTDELRIKYKADAQKWMDEKPPPAVQRRYVHAKHSELWGLNLTNKDAREVPRTRSSRIRRVHVLSIRDADSYIGWIPGSPRGRCGHIVCVTFYLIMCITNHGPRNSYDINDKLGGTSFKASYDWENSGMVQAFSKWTAESFGTSLLCLVEKHANTVTLP